MDGTAMKQSAYGTPAYHTAGSAMMSFAPVNQIHQHLCAFHSYAHDPSRQVRSHHFCTHRGDLHQCLIFDGPNSGARLIGIEYIVPSDIFETLDAEEKKYWHSHKYEVESGLLQMITKPLVPSAAVDLAEQPAMLTLRRTFGKTIHTWAFDEHPDLPLGPPHLMMSFIKDGEVKPEHVTARDADLGLDTRAKRAHRASYIPADGFEPSHDADRPAHTGKKLQLQLVES